MRVKTIYSTDGTPISISEEGFELLRKHENYQQFVDSAVADLMQSLKEKGDEDGIRIPKDVLRIMVTEGCSLVRAWRKHFNLTQAQLAEMVGIKQGTLSEIENSNKNHSETIKKITSVLLNTNPKQLATAK